MNEVIAISMTAHNDAAWLDRSIGSFLSQKCCRRELKLVISLDSCTDGSEDVIRPYLSDNRIILSNNNFGSAPRNRNFILEYVRVNLANCVLIGRLDADDELNESNAISAIEKVFDRYRCDTIVAANYQRKNGSLSSFVNRPDMSLLNPESLLERLSQMAVGKWEAELPSCNTFFRPSLPIRYPDIQSAEDHWLLVDLLLRQEKYHVCLEPDLIYSIYSIGGSQTQDNFMTGTYLDARRKLLDYAKSVLAYGK